MISFIEPLVAGRAVRIILTPAVGATRWRLLRRLDANFAGHDDPGAVLVIDGQDHGTVDTTGLENGTLYYYREYSLVEDDWIGSEVAQATPAYSAASYGPNPLLLVRERLAQGLREELILGRLHHSRGEIQVLTAPPLWESTVFPVVTVQMLEEQSREWGIGADFEDLSLSPDWREYDGWIASANLQIMSWSLNPDERILLRDALRRIIQANLLVLGDAGLINIDYQSRDLEDFEAYGAPVYFSRTTLTCEYVSMTGHTVDEIVDIEVNTQYADPVI